MPTKDEYIQALQRKAPKMRCPACGNASFATADGEWSPIQSEGDTTHLDRAIRSAMLVCNHCGHMQLFAVDKLMG
jgi:hypothetical protein